METGTIYGAARDNEKTAEAYPHFHHEGHPDGGNLIDHREVRLFFQCDLQEIKGGGIPAGYGPRFEAGRVHVQFSNWDEAQPDREYRFWQAIIHPETPNPLTFDSYSLIRSARLSRGQQKMFDRHTRRRTPIRVIWHPGSVLAQSKGQPPPHRLGFWERLTFWRP